MSDFSKRPRFSTLTRVGFQVTALARANLVFRAIYCNRVDAFFPPVLQFAKIDSFEQRFCFVPRHGTAVNLAPNANDD